jgi:hypothetical protein
LLSKYACVHDKYNENTIRCETVNSDRWEEFPVITRCVY